MAMRMPMARARKTPDRMDHWQMEVPVELRVKDWELLQGGCLRAVPIHDSALSLLPWASLYRPCPNPIGAGEGAIQCDYHRSLEAEFFLQAERIERRKREAVRHEAVGMVAIVIGTFLLCAVVVGWVLFGLEVYWWTRYAIAKGGALALW